jgi:uncharacterized membrane protein
MWVSRYFVFFIVFSFLGWVYETTFSVIRKGHWENRGFLFGPICPIYGAGGITAVAVIDNLSRFGRADLSNWEIFGLAFVISFFLEYCTSWVLEKLFHAYWWDYSNVPLNINGRVCLPASIGFGLAGILVVRVLVPVTDYITAIASPILMEILALLMMAMLACDLTVTVSALSDFQKNVVKLSELINDHMIELVEDVKSRKPARRIKLSPENELLLQEKIAEMRSSMNLLHTNAVSRMQGVRYPKLDKDRAEYIFKKIKEKTGEKINEKIEASIADKVASIVENAPDNATFNVPVKPAEDAAERAAESDNDNINGVNNESNSQ